ncbi:MAG: polysaccharide deacetylase family protein [Phycisphaerae bacterium]
MIDRLLVRQACRVVPLLPLCAIAGCLPAAPCENAASGGGTTLVLTFDDGPLPADVAQIDAPLDSDALLAPLRDILATLHARHLPAVFFVQGPRTTAAADALRAVYAEALVEIHAAGHVAGYHGFAPDPPVWIQPLTPPVLAAGAMSRDLDRLVAYLDAALAPTGVGREQVFAPVFRQPFGGAGVSRSAGVLAAAARGWTYRGFALDSTDWIVNADAPLALLGIDELTAESAAARVAERLARAAHRPRDGRIVDVLFHVNHLTATHLDAWLDVLMDAFESADGAPPIFDVPACYLSHSDATVDFGVFVEP